jgi:hypothetical protein
LGDVLSARVEITHPVTVTLEPPVFPKALGTFEVRASSPLPSQVSGLNQVDRFQLELQNFTTGPQILPPMPFLLKNFQGARQSVLSGSATVTVQEIPAGPKDKGDIRGIKGVWGPVAWSPWWWALAAALLVAAGVWGWKKRKRVLQGPPPPPPIPPEVAALSALRAIQASDWLATGKVKEFYSATSDALRAYLEGAFGVAALERTTGELMRDIRRNPHFSSERLAQLKEILEECDLVKFAKYRPDVEDGQRIVAAAIDFVEQTKTLLKKEQGTA